MDSVVKYHSEPWLDHPSSPLWIQHVLLHRELLHVLPGCDDVGICLGHGYLVHNNDLLVGYN